MEAIKKLYRKISYGIKELWDLWAFLCKKLKGKIFPKSLLGRFILIILLPLIALQIVASMVFFEHHWYLISRRLANDIAGEVNTLAYVLEEYPDSEQTDALLKQMEDDLMFEISFAKDQTLDENAQLTGGSSIVKQVRKALWRNNYSYQIQENLKKDYILIYIQLKTGVLEVRVPRKRFFSTTTYAFLLWMILASILLFWIAFLFMKNQVRAVTRLARAAENFGTGRPVQMFKPEGASEVRQAGMAFLNMQNRISRYLLERTSMLSGVSHDLKTPLTRMKLQLSMTRVEGAEDLLNDIDEMEKMLEGYLSFAKGEGKEPMKKVEISALLQDIVEKLRRNGQEIDLHIEQKQEITIRPNDFSRAITNILSNAHRYAHNAYVNVGVRDNFLDITIDDDGPGIPASKREDVFKAFYRLDASRNAKTGGIGLGLTIARDIVLAHGGEITLEDSPQKGLRVHLKLPL
ncbi:MAG: HAMP domain-containing histidine kinase [Alphaproteobacteria bacterium]|nr:HAMP domain-containing histidine kinase [Alphaproteobacteria bacterium]